MADKVIGDKLDCGQNIYRGNAHAKASVSTGFVWAYIGPRLGAPVPPDPLPAPAPLAPAALAALKTAAETSAQNEAKGDIAKIAAYLCPQKTCKHKTVDATDLVGDATSGKARVVPGATDIRIPTGTALGDLIIEIRTQEWLVEAEQEYLVIITCE